ncbi:hypothetical protein EDB87DRAFT_139742 [Lactarius vividus]|nr:hypothetical protein EDB87DRAFT_139742 [Lactarius vividus]
MNSTQVSGSQGSRSQPEGAERVEVTVIRAHNVPQFGSILSVKTEYFVTIAYVVTTKKAKKKTKTKSVQIDGQMARLRINETLIGTHEVVIPVESTNISVALNHGHGRVESTPPVTLDLMITVSTNGAPPSDPQTIPTEGDDTHAEEVRQPTTRTDSGGPDQSTAPEHPLPPSDHPPVQIGTPVPQDIETSLVEARIGLDRADEVGKSIDRSDTWEGVVGKIKWVMDKLSPVAELHPIAQMGYKVLSVIPEELSKQYQRDNNVRNLVKTMHDAFDFANHEDTLISIRPESREAEILTRMLRDVPICSSFIQSYGDSQFLVRMAKSMDGGVDEKVQQLSTTFVENKRAFLDQTVVATKITAFQILNDVGKISAELKWMSTQLSDVALDVKIEQIPYRKGSRFTPDKRCLPGTRTDILDFIFKWVNNPASERGLVLFGQAGTGKSSIAHEIARRFDEMGGLTSSFIFIRKEIQKEQSRTNAYHLFTNLARHLADRYPLFKTALGRVIKDDTSLRLDARDYDTLFRRFIQEPLKDLPIVGPILVVIDALDESGDTTGKQGLHRFLAQHISELPSNFRVFITSRLEGDIGPAFLEAKSVVVKRMDDDVLRATTHHDIRTFLQENLNSDDFKNYGEALASRAEGLFQWAAVACGYIQEHQSVGGKRERIKHLLQLAADYHGQDPLDELYKEVLEAYFKNEEAVFRFLVGQLLAAFEPLSIRSLTTMLQHAPNDNAPNSVVKTLSQLGSLLSNVTSSDDTLPIVPFHTSFRDFVTNKEKSGNFYVDLRDAHRQLAHSCLCLAVDDLKFNICKLESSYVANKDVEGLESRLPNICHLRCRMLVVFGTIIWNVLISKPISSANLEVSSRRSFCIGWRRLA